MRDSETSFKRVFGIRDFPYLKLGKLSGFGVLKQNWVEIRVCAGGGTPKLSFRITGLEIPNGDRWGPTLKVAAE